METVKGIQSLLNVFFFFIFSFFEAPEGPQTILTHDAGAEIYY